MVSILLNSLLTVQRRRASSVRTECVLIESMRLRRTGRRRTGLSPALGVLRLSALWAVSSQRTDLLPQSGADTLPPAQRQAALFSVFAALAASIAKKWGLRSG